MTPIADMIEQMIAKGAALDVIVLAVRVVEASRVTSPLRHGVTPGAIRQRKYRKNNKQNQPSAEANDAADAVTTERHALRNGVTERCDLTSLLTSSEPIEEATKEEKKKKGTEQVEGRKSARGTRITEDFQPSASARELASSLGVDPEALRVEFIDFWIAVPGLRGLKLDWDKTYKNRAREIARRRNGQSNGHAPRPGSKDDTRERTVNALRNLDPFPYANDVGRGEGAGPPIPRQLSLVKPARS